MPNHAVMYESIIFQYSRVPLCRRKSPERNVIETMQLRYQRILSRMLTSTMFRVTMLVWHGNARYSSISLQLGTLEPLVS